MVKTVMIVDDTRDTVEMVEKFLKTEGYNVMTAFNGKEALEILQKGTGEEKPDLILLDMFMPEMSGREVLEHIRADKNPWIRDIKIAFFTVAAFKDYGRQILENLKVIDYIVKPFDIDDLLRRIQKILGE